MYLNNIYHMEHLQSTENFQYIISNFHKNSAQYHHPCSTGETGLSETWSNLPSSHSWEIMGLDPNLKDWALPLTMLTTY